MQMDHDQISMVRAELSDMVACLSGTFSASRPRQFLEQVDAIRSRAALHGFSAVENVARSLETAMARDSGETLMQCHVDAMHDAIGCAQAGAKQCEALLASISLRMNG